MAYQNFFATKLFTDIGAADTTITLETVPTATSGRLVLEARNPTQREIIKYTGVAGNQITGVTRGQGGTTAKTHLKNALVEMNATSEDLQDLYDAFASFAASTGSWLNAVTSITAVTNNGNRNYDLTTSTDMTSILSPGMRVRTTRTVPAPTQSALLNGTSQYFSKSSPNGMTFTDDFVVSAWIKLPSYSAVAQRPISRWDGTNGWVLEINASGQVLLFGNNGAPGNFKLVCSIQSLPLNKWVHVTAQLDMSAITGTNVGIGSTTNYIMFDGVEIPVTTSQGGTNPTAFIQAGSLNIGAANGVSFYGGTLDQVAIFSAKVTQATMRGYMTQGLAGTEPNLVSAYSLSNSLNDLKAATANNLTANGGATTTNADAPFGGQGNRTISSVYDFGIVQSVTPTNINVQAAEGCTFPTTGGISALSYSFHEAPFNFPADEAKFTLQVVFKVTLSHTNPSSGATVQNVLSGAPTSLPAGRWIPGGTVPIYSYRSTGGTHTVRAGWSTGNAVITNPVGQVAQYLNSSAASELLTTPSVNNTPINLSTAATYYFYIVGENSTNNIQVRGEWPGYDGAIWTFKSAYY